MPGLYYPDPSIEGIKKESAYIISGLPACRAPICFGRRLRLPSDQTPRWPRSRCMHRCCHSASLRPLRLCHRDDRSQTHIVFELVVVSPLRILQRNLCHHLNAKWMPHPHSARAKVAGRLILYRSSVRLHISEAPPTSEPMPTLPSSPRCAS